MMTREDQLVFCKQCLNRRMDMRQGLICDLTGEKAAFQDECPDFKVDEAIKVAPVVTEETLQSMLEKLRLEQKLMPGIAAGVVAGILGAILWGAVTVWTGFQIGYMAVAIGAGVGLAIRKFGHGVDSIFGIWGAVIALFSLLLGNVLSLIGFAAREEGLGYLETMSLIDYSYLPAAMAETFAFVDLIFYGIAIYEGYKFSFRVVTEEDMQEAAKKDK